MPHTGITYHLLRTGSHWDKHEAHRLLTNGGLAPIPPKIKNQRQKRKASRKGIFGRYKEGCIGALRGISNLRASLE